MLDTLSDTPWSASKDYRYGHEMKFTLVKLTIIPVF
jgi:hypothetical protein